jgi:hypothetical protein
VNLAQTIDDSYQRDLALTKIAAICATDGDGDQADSLVGMMRMTPFTQQVLSKSRPPMPVR